MSARTERPWVCRKCGTKNARAKVKCIGYVCRDPRADPSFVACDGRRPKRPVKAHMKVLRDNRYEAYCKVAADIHGVTDESCCACGKPRAQERRHDRDHDHRPNRMRGLLCPAQIGCNRLLLPWITANVARAIADAKATAGEPDAERWDGLACYLERVEQHYAKEGL